MLVLSTRLAFDYSMTTRRSFLESYALLVACDFLLSLLLRSHALFALLFSLIRVGDSGIFFFVRRRTWSREDDLDVSTVARLLIVGACCGERDEDRPNTIQVANELRRD
ncbi:hypothetical protein DY000_02007818 [Brassica cretica]|uniref:Uncharacterized protein n=1 Tax=Brassica cretica TaxID=69181 RepID=A0ABQ7C5N9_BRACR|nr:hypothetical protein DY000_02007818 [Brassica cretica]